MNIIDFLDGYEQIAKSEATAEDVDILYTFLRPKVMQTGVGLQFFKAEVDRLDKVIAIDFLAHEFHRGNYQLLNQIFPDSDYNIVKFRLDALAGLEAESEVRKYNRNYFTTLLSEEGITLLTKQVGSTSRGDISDAIRAYKNLYEAQLKIDDGTEIVSDAELLTLFRFTGNNKYKELFDSRDHEEPTVVGGYASVEIIDKEGHLITTEALEEAFENHMKSFRTRNIMISHSDVQVGWPLPAFINKKGEVFKSGVDDKGLYLVTECRPDTQIAEKVRKGIENGEFKSYSIAGTATKKSVKTKNNRTFMQVDGMEMAEVTICEKPVNQESHFKMLKSEDDEWIDKGVKYLSENEKPPHNEKVFTGKKGGRYYLTSTSQDKDEEGKEKDPDSGEEEIELTPEIDPTKQVLHQEKPLPEEAYINEEDSMAQKIYDDVNEFNQELNKVFPLKDKGDCWYHALVISEKLKADGYKTYAVTREGHCWVEVIDDKNKQHWVDPTRNSYGKEPPGLTGAPYRYGFNALTTSIGPKNLERFELTRRILSHLWDKNIKYPPRALKKYPEIEDIMNTDPDELKKAISMLKSEDDEWIDKAHQQTPPFEGGVFDEQKHRWVKPEVDQPSKIKPIKQSRIEELKKDPSVFWHGTASQDLRGGKTGLHVGTHQAAKEALGATIGIPAKGDWDGTREYGKTLLAGKKTLKRLDPRGFNVTGFNVEAPEEDYYPTGKATYSNNEQVPMHVKPILIPVKIRGEMTNRPGYPHSDIKANAMMAASKKKGTARRGYFYENVGEDVGSISAVVPGEEHLEIIQKASIFDISGFLDLTIKADDIKLSTKAIIKNEDGEILILKDAYSDYWDLPGGHVQDEETIQDSLDREVNEESGLDILEAEEYMTTEMTLGKETKPVVFFIATAEGDVKLSKEHTDYEWISADEIKDYNLGKFSDILSEALGLKSSDENSEDDDSYDFEKEDAKSDEKPSVSSEKALKIGDKLGVNWDDVDKQEFINGMNVELEHSDITGGDLETTAKITLAHLDELPDYYTRLKEMESEVKKSISNWIQKQRLIPKKVMVHPKIGKPFERTQMVSPEDVQGYKTAISRKDAPEPLRWLKDKKLLSGRVLDHGSGRYTEEGIEAYDPHWKPDKPTGKFDTIMSNYVLNVVSEETQKKILGEFHDLLEDSGKVYITVRRDLPKEGKPGKGTFQRFVELPFKSLNKNSTREIYEASKEDLIFETVEKSLYGDVDQTLDDENQPPAEVKQKVFKKYLGKSYLESLNISLSKAALVPKKITVHPKTGKPFTRTQMVSPEEIESSKIEISEIFKPVEKSKAKMKRELIKKFGDNPTFKEISKGLALYTQGFYKQIRDVSGALVSKTLEDFEANSSGYMRMDIDKGKKDPLMAIIFMASVKDIYGNSIEDDSEEGKDTSSLTYNKVKKWASIILNALEKVPPNNIPMYRGVMMDKPLDLKIGEEFDLASLTSFTRDREIGIKFSQGKASGQLKRWSKEHPVLLQIEGNNKALDIDVFSPWNQKEVITNGSFEVTNISEEGYYPKIQVISLKQKNIAGSDWPSGKGVHYSIPKEIAKNLTEDEFNIVKQMVWDKEHHPKWNSTIGTEREWREGKYGGAKLKIDKDRLLDAVDKLGFDYDVNSGDVIFRKEK